MKEKFTKKGATTKDPELLRQLAKLDALRDEDIDLSDDPETKGWPKGERGRFYRPLKEQVTLRLDADILHWFKTREARGYQTRINAALRKFVEREERKTG